MGPNINTLNNNKQELTDILKCMVEINTQDVMSTIDTGTNPCIIVLDLAKSLNLPIKYDNKNTVTLANNQVTNTFCTCNKVPVKMNNKIYKCDAIVLQNTAQLLLLGTNCLQKHKVKIDFDKQTISMKGDKSISFYKTKMDQGYKIKQEEHHKPIKIYNK